MEGALCRPVTGKGRLNKEAYIVITILQVEAAAAVMLNIAGFGSRPRPAPCEKPVIVICNTAIDTIELYGNILSDNHGADHADVCHINRLIPAVVLFGLLHQRVYRSVHALFLCIIVIDKAFTP